MQQPLSFESGCFTFLSLKAALRRLFRTEEADGDPLAAQYQSVAAQWNSLTNQYNDALLRYADTDEGTLHPHRNLRHRQIFKKHKVLTINIPQLGGSYRGSPTACR